MGCIQSKAPPTQQQSKDSSSAPVVLCRERSVLLGEAIRRRYALADVHRAYAASLLSIGAVLHDFLNAVLHDFSAPPLQLALPAAADHLLTQGNNGEQRDDDDSGHIHFPPASDQEEDDEQGCLIQFPLVEVDEDGEDGHIQFPSDEEDTVLPRHEHLLPQPVEEETGEEFDDEEIEEEPLFLPLSPSPFPPSFPMAAPPYSYAPPYTTYGPSYEYNSGAEMGTYYSPIGPSSYAYGGTDMGNNSYGPPSFANTNMMNYARSQPLSPSVTYEHHLHVTDATTVRYHRYQNQGALSGPLPLSSGSYSHYGSGSYPNQYPQQGGGSSTFQYLQQGGRSSPYQYPQQGSGSYPYQYPQQGGRTFTPVAPYSSSSYHRPMPPPSPPKVSSWEFMNPFETFQNSYYPQQMPPTMAVSRAPRWTSGEPLDDGDDDDMLEMEEDMLELEDDEEELGEVIEEAYADVQRRTIVNDNVKLDNKEEQSSSSATSDELMHRKKSVFLDADNTSVSEEESQSSGDDGIGNATHVVVEEEQQLNNEDSAIAGLPTEPEKMYNDDVQVVQEIKAQFDRASKSAGEVCEVLEVGKVPYNSGLKVSSMTMICALPSSGKDFLEFEEEKAMQRGNLSSTLQELYMWEKKLLEEVKTEEKIRILYDQKFKEVKSLYKKGAEAHKLQAAQMHTRKLSMKISVAMKAVKSISDRINKLRDEELWPQTHELIQGFMQMWHAMSECHQIQCHALSQAKDIDSSIAAATLFSEAHIDLIKQLELQLLDMTANFAEWFSAQKSYVSTLNEWLKKGVEYVPEVTDDGVAPFSPGRLGAPPIFTICNIWATSIARISEVEVVNTMQAFASNVLGIWERHMSVRRQGMLAADKDMGRDLRLMRRDEVSMRKAVQAQKKKLVRVASKGGSVFFTAKMLHDGVPPADCAGLQSSMHKSFEAMEGLATACANAFKDLQLRCEEEKARLAQEKAQLPDCVADREAN